MGCLRVNKTTIAPLLIGALLPLLGCGGDDDKPKPRPTPTPTSPPTPQPTAFLIPVLPGAQRQANLGNAVSHDGRVEVGGSESAGGMQAFRWTAGGDLQALGFLPGYTDSSEATAVSADGSVVAGASTAASGESRAFIWTAETGMQPLGELPDFIVCSQALAMSVGGTVVVGTGEGVDPNYGDDKTLCFRWTADEGFHWFGDFLPAGVEGTLCEAYGISSDGRVIVGAARYDVAEDDTPLVQGFRFTSDPGLFPLGWVDDATPESSALSASANGAVIGGSSDQHTETG
ncbi:hypothetical protein L6Q96_11160 [Candidatus Binatia bacterium]|nr:hypothetical protein [Candidatus Binatia bacterium]